MTGSTRTTPNGVAPIPVAVDVALAGFKTLEIRRAKVYDNGRIEAEVSKRDPDGNLEAFSPVLFDDGSGEYIGRKRLNIDTTTMVEVETQLRAALGVPRGSKVAPRQRRIVRAGSGELAPPEYVIDGILPKNALACIVSKEASYKTFAALGMAAAIHTGADWAGRDTERAPVLYLAAEGSGGMRRRLRAWEIANRADLSDLWILPAPVNFTDASDLERLYLEIESLGELPALIVVDTLARNFGGNENSAEDMGRFIAACDRLRTLTGSCVLVIHHENKLGGYRGSTAFAGAMDTMIEAKREGVAVTLTCRKQKDDTEFEPVHLAARVVELGFDDRHDRPVTSIVLQPTDAAFVARQRDASGEARVLTAKERGVLEVLQNTPAGKLRYADWKAQSGLPANTFDRIRLLLLEWGHIRKTPGGGYAPTPESLPNDPHITTPTPTPLRGVGVGVVEDEEEDDPDELPF